MWYIRKINRTAGKLLMVWTAVLLMLSVISQGKRMLKIYHQEICAEDVTVEISHTDSREYLYYKEESEKEGCVLVCIGETKCYWSTKEAELLLKDGEVNTSIDMLTVTYDGGGIYPEQTSCFVKYGIWGEEGFSEAEIEKYKELAARAFTYERFSLFGFQEAPAYEVFVAEKNIY